MEQGRKNTLLENKCEEKGSGEDSHISVQEKLCEKRGGVKDA